MHAFWRILAGWASGHLMSGIPHLATLGCADRQRRRASALVMAGAGIGALIGALSVGSLPKETVELHLKRICGISKQYSHPRGTFKPAVSFGISLGEQLGHAVF